MNLISIETIQFYLRNSTFNRSIYIAYVHCLDQSTHMMKNAYIHCLDLSLVWWRRRRRRLACTRGRATAAAEEAGVHVR
jgi:hypothetical protein